MGFLQEALLNTCSAKWKLLVCLLIFAIQLAGDADAKAAAHETALECGVTFR